MPQFQHALDLALKALLRTLASRAGTCFFWLCVCTCVQVSYPGFYTYFNPNCGVKQDAVKKVDAVMSPFMNPGDSRVILTWGKEPDDLDIQLSLPTGTVCLVRVCVSFLCDKL